MQPDSARLLRDMLDAGEFIALHSRGYSEFEFLGNEALQAAVYWKFVIIGEALSQLRYTDLEVTRQITEWERIVRFRNQLIHGYRVIQAEITWQIISEKLPILIDELRRLLQT